MAYLSLNIDMQDQVVLVVGAGQVACRKVRTLLESGAVVRVVASEVLEELAGLQAAGCIAVQYAYYQPDMLDGVFLVVAATNSAETNAAIAADARQRGILVASATTPEIGTCTFPAILRRGDLQIAVSTGGRCPAFAVQVRDTIAATIGIEYADALERLAADREKLVAEGKGTAYVAPLACSQACQSAAELLDAKEQQ